MKKKAISMFVVVSALTAATAMAAEKSPALFATDVLKPMTGSVSVGYDFEQDKQASRIYLNGVEVALAHVDWSKNNMTMRAEVGLGYGVQVSVAQKVSVGGSVDVSVDGVGNLYHDNLGGAYNPDFELKWNPMQIVNATSPFQAVIGYRVAPKGIASTHDYDDFTKNRFSAYGSYALNDAKIRPYLGYEFATYGNDSSSFGGGRTAGHTNSLTVGAEYTLMKDLAVDLSYNWTNTGGDARDAYTTAYNAHTMAMKAQYKVPGVPVVDAYIVPFGEVRMNAERDVEYGFGDTKKIESYATYKVGGFVKVVF